MCLKLIVSLDELNQLAEGLCLIDNLNAKNGTSTITCAVESLHEIVKSMMGIYMDIYYQEDES